MGIFGYCKSSLYSALAKPLKSVSCYRVPLGNSASTTKSNSRGVATPAVSFDGRTLRPKTRRSDGINQIPR